MDNFDVELLLRFCKSQSEELEMVSVSGILPELNGYFNTRKATDLLLILDSLSDPPAATASPSQTEEEESFDILLENVAKSAKVFYSLLVPFSPFPPPPPTFPPPPSFPLLFLSPLLPLAPLSSIFLLFYASAFSFLPYLTILEGEGGGGGNGRSFPLLPPFLLPLLEWIPNPSFSLHSPLSLSLSLSLAFFSLLFQ